MRGDRDALGHVRRGIATARDLAGDREPGHSSSRDAAPNAQADALSLAATADSRHYRETGMLLGSDRTGVPPGKCTTTITWKKAATKGTEIRVYGVTGCLSLTERQGDGSCLVKHTLVPASARKLIAKAPASKGKIVWTGPSWRDLVQGDTGGTAYTAYGVDRHGDDIYFAIVLAAYNAAGHSKFVIADAGQWCYDTGCDGWGP